MSEQRQGVPGPAADPADGRNEKRRSGPWKFLAAEDNSMNRKVLEAFLTADGHEVDFAVDGRECLEALGRGKYDAVLMDIQMPEMDGLEATAAIRASEAPLRDIPVIAVTANAMGGDREFYLRHGMNDFLAKPIESSELRRVIEEVLLAAGSSTRS